MTVDDRVVSYQQWGVDSLIEAISQERVLGAVNTIAGAREQAIREHEGTFVGDLVAGQAGPPSGLNQGRNRANPPRIAEGPDPGSRP